jgi:hypothetical protein
MEKYQLEHLHKYFIDKSVEKIIHERNLPEKYAELRKKRVKAERDRIIDTIKQVVEFEVSPELTKRLDR